MMLPTRVEDGVLPMSTTSDPAIHGSAMNRVSPSLRGDERTRTADPLLAKHAQSDAVTCTFARRRGQTTESRVPEGVGWSPENAETVHIRYTPTASVASGHRKYPGAYGT
jgi:hypothetical protein